MEHAMKKQNFTVEKKTAGKFRTPSEVYNQQMKTKEAYIIILDMNKHGKTVDEIRNHLRDGGYVTKQLNPFCIETIRKYIKQKNQKPNGVKKVNTQPKFDNIPVPVGVKRLTEAKTKEDIDVLKLATDLLPNRFRQTRLGYEVKFDGVWRAVRIHELMREINKIRKRWHMEQITNNPDWVIT